LKTNKKWLRPAFASTDLFLSAPRGHGKRENASGADARVDVPGMHADQRG